MRNYWNVKTTYIDTHDGVGSIISFMTQDSNLRCSILSIGAKINCVFIGRSIFIVALTDDALEVWRYLARLIVDSYLESIDSL